MTTLLMHCRVAGFRHHLGIRFWPQLRKGDPLTLRREPGNRHDPRAIRIEWRGAILGYVPKEANFAAAQLMDRGTSLRACIGELRAGGDPSQRLIIEVAAEDASPQASLAVTSRTLDAMVAIPQPPTLVLAPDAPATGAVHDKAVAVLQEAVTQLAWRLSAPPVALSSPAGREVRLWESVSLSVDAQGHNLRAAYLGCPTQSPPCASLDLDRPVSSAHWIDALLHVVKQVARDHGLPAAIGPLPLAAWMQHCLRLTFHDYVDFAALRQQVRDHLAPDPLARALANRIFAPSPEAEQYNWVCTRAPVLALLAVEAPRLVPFVHLLQGDPHVQAAPATVAALTSRLKALVPGLAAEDRRPRVLRVLDRPPPPQGVQEPASQPAQMQLLGGNEAAA